jgi:hypothetical protein
MTEVVVLPENLTDGLDLGELNRGVRQGTVRLDWSGVRFAPRPALEVLLAGCDLVQDSDALGVSTMPSELSAAIIDVIFSVPTDGVGAGSAVPAPADRISPVDGVGPGGGPLLRGSALPDSGLPKSGSETENAVAERRQTYRIGGEKRVLTPPSPAVIRRELEDLILKDLLGPAEGPEEEVRESRVSERYLAGLLAPSGQAMSADADDDIIVGGVEADEDSMPEQDTLGPTTMFPSSLGLTFVVSHEARALRLAAGWGRYERVHSETHTTPKGSPAMVWKRIPMEGASEPQELRRRFPIEWRPCPDDAPRIVVRGTVRQSPEGFVVTLFLINESAPLKRLPDRAWVFQPEVIVEDADGAPVFLHRPLRRAQSASDDAGVEEEESLEMLYRRHREFAVGHGVSVHAELPPGESDRAIRLRTRAVPEYDVPATVMPDRSEIAELDRLSLDMRELAEMETTPLLENLETLASAYARWIGERRKDLDGPAEGLQPYTAAAEAALSACEAARARVAEGIELLRSDSQALEAFRFRNRAMWRQRTHTLYSQAVRDAGDADMTAIDVPENRSWRLFQLAFILLNLPGIADLHHPDRRADPEAIADLLWFPTGGGKTEAYLGLTAFTLGMRRLQGSIAGRDGEHGVAVLMRYTLRLLTLQQFQRAAALICACETIRQEAWFDGDTRWGVEPFRLGLWVGHRTTPNTTESSAEAIRQEHGQRRQGAVGGSGSPAQLTHCPWCGSRIDPGRDIRVEPAPGGRGRTFMFCGDIRGACPFSAGRSPDEGLPLIVVDEELYHRLPALLISTVDKFAQMPWRGEAQMLFGQVDGYCERHGFRSPDVDDELSHIARGSMPRARTVPAGPLRPPDLIIQDELHLISGPLGSLMGLYETAIDRLASWEVDGRTVRPKVIASTATIRRASDQVRGIFLRTVSVFPPHGLDVEDNFFSRQRPPGDKDPGRRYIGVYTPGRRLKAALIRVYVAHLAAAQEMYERYGASADPWMTLVGYFNSMRELGGMRRLVDDDVRSRLRNARDHGLANRRLGFVEELTSRKSSTDIPEVLERLERRFDPEEQAERQARRKGGAKGLPGPIDVLLASNMLSVGVDVPRLGLMIVAGQPKTTAEYIQATSRVGRSAEGPGLICTVFNWTRPRDLSHYERFEHYHATFYQQVEALSVTPFASRARDRGLTALLVSLVRLGGGDLNSNLAAAEISLDHPRVREALDAIAQRAGLVSGHDDLSDLVRAELERRLQAWEMEASRTEGGRRLGYKGRNDGVTVGLLQSPDLERWGEFTCLQSLRDVEPEIGLILSEGGMDEEPEPLTMRPWERDEAAEEDGAVTGDGAVTA